MEKVGVFLCTGCDIGEALEDLAPSEAPVGAVRPGQQQRRDDERAREVRQPPRPPHLADLVGADDVAEPQRRRPEARADRGADRARRDDNEPELEFVPA